MAKISRQLLGAHKDPYDPRAWIAKLGAIQDADLSQWRPTVKDQGDCGSCVGMAISSVLTAEANKLGVVLPDYQRFSETDIYNGGRYIDGSLSWDEGTYPSSALEWLRLRRCLPYKSWQYKGFEKMSRTSALDKDAMPYPLSSSTPLTIGYYRVTGGIEGILSALSAEHPVGIGIPWPRRYMSSKDGVLPALTSSDYMVGGHEVYLYKSMISAERVIGANSWGENAWSYTGKVVPKGCFSMPFSSFNWFKAEGGYDAHYVIVDWGKPEPPQPIPGSTLQLRLSRSTDGQTWTPLYEGVV